MEDKLKYPLDIQLFAEGDPEPPKDPEPQPKPAEVDYDKLAEAIEKRKSRTEEGAIRGILKDQGLSGDELNEAVKAYKESKANKAKEEQERIDKILKENKEFKQKELLNTVVSEAKAIAKELKVREDRFDKLMKLCGDVSTFIGEDGKINKEAIKKEMEEQIKELPEFVSAKNIVITKGKGTDVPPAATDAEAYRQKKYGKNKYFKG